MSYNMHTFLEHLRFISKPKVDIHIPIRTMSFRLILKVCIYALTCMLIK